MLQKTAILLLMISSLGGMLSAQPLSIFDDFEGNGTITTWAPDGLGIDLSLPNPQPGADNASATVMEYHDTGGQYANVRFDAANNFDLSIHHIFSLKIYVPTSGLTGSAPQQVSLKLQDGTLAQPWTTQTEIIKSIVLDQWQILTFDFGSDPYINFDNNSAAPTQRNDLNRVLIQVNGENNTDQVLAYIDDVAYIDTTTSDPGFDYLVWADEFDGTGPINTELWWHQTQLPNNGTSWWGGELQHYTDRTENAYLADGKLHLVAKKESYTDQGINKQYTSARLNSKMVFTYGRVEVRAKLPTGDGTLPAIWMLGQNINEPGAYWQTQGYGEVLWPACGEIDIMEHWGANLNHVSSATHTPSSHGNTVNVGSQSIPTATTDFHLYSLEWTQERLTFAVDGQVHLVYQPPVRDADTWPFDAPMYLLLNIAILPTIVPSFTETTMEIDYLRVYQADAPTSTVPPQAEPIQLYPNPFRETMSLHLPAAIGRDIQFSLYDPTGRLIKHYSRRIDQPKVLLEGLGEIPSGIYFLQFTYQGIPRSIRLVKS